MRRCGTLLTLLLFALAVGGTSHAARTYVTLEQGVERPGLDYKSFWLKKDSPELCRQACADDEKCMAYTFVKPGVQGPQARCFLKARIPSAKRSDCCVSGVKTTKSPSLTTAPPGSGPVAKMATPEVKDSQMTPKIQGEQFSSITPGTKLPPYRSPSTAKKDVGDQISYTHPPTTEKHAGDQDAEIAISMSTANKKRRNLNPTKTLTPVVKGDKANYGRKPFYFTGNVKIEPDSQDGSESFKVPDEYLLVIETISARCLFGPGQQPARFLVHVFGPEKGKDKILGLPQQEMVTIYIPLSKQHGDSGWSEWVGTQQVRLYAFPASTALPGTSSVHFYVLTDKKNTNISAGCDCSLSGYLLDLDSPSLAP